MFGCARVGKFGAHALNMTAMCAFQLPLLGATEHAKSGETGLPHGNGFRRKDFFGLSLFNASAVFRSLGADTVQQERLLTSPGPLTS